jgi:hypothetical protein
MSFTVVIWAVFGGIVTIYGPVGGLHPLPPAGIPPFLAGISDPDVRGGDPADPALSCRRALSLAQGQIGNGMPPVQDQKRVQTEDLPGLLRRHRKLSPSRKSG